MTPRELARKYPVIEEQVAAVLPPDAAITAEAFCESRDVRRFFRRLGLISRGRPDASASQTILAVIDAVARRTGAEQGRARAILSAYCRSNGQVAAVCGKTPLCDGCPLTGDCAYASRRPTMKQLPEGEQPRERLVELGEAHLTDAELIAIIIRSGTPELSAVGLAQTLLARFGGFRELARCSPAQLRQVGGIGPAKATAIKAALEIGKRFDREPHPTKPGAFLSPEAVFERYRSRLGGEKRETFVALLLDAKNRLIRDVTVSLGSLTQSIVHPREAFQPAIRDSAAAVIFVHNHPSGDTEPSREDADITRRLKQTGDVIGIRVLDHVIVSETGFTSLANKGLL